MLQKDARLERAMNLSVVEGSLATVMGTLLGGIFLTGFALQIGASRFQIGLMAAIPTLSNAAQFFAANILNRTGRSKRLCMLATWTSRLMWIPILLIPFLFASRPGTEQAWWVIGLLAISGAFASIGGLAWLDWIKHLIPDTKRIHFLGRRNLYNSGLSLGMSFVAGVLITVAQRHSEATPWGFLAVFTVAILCGIVGTFLLSRIPAADYQVEAWTKQSNPWLMSLSERSFRSLVSAYAVWSFANQIATPFFAVYMLQKLALPFWAVTLLAMSSSLVSLLANQGWVKLQEQFGVRPIVLIAVLVDALVPLFWLAVSPATVWLVVPIHAFAIVNAPLVTGPQNMLLRLVPSTNGASYMALFNAVVGVCAATGAVTGGWLAGAMQGQWLIGSLELTGLQLLFGISAILKLASLGMLSRLEESHSTSVKSVLNHLLSFSWRTRITGPATGHNDCPVRGASDPQIVRMPIDVATELEGRPPIRKAA